MKYLMIYHTKVVKPGFLANLLPYLMIGIASVLGIFVLLVMLTVLFWGTLVGLIIYGVLVIKRKFFNYKKHPRTKYSGRIINCDDYDKD